MKPYTYLIGWPEHNTWYYGVRYAKGCNPSDLWNPYKTSSTHVAAFVAEHGEPPVRQIRNTFDNAQAARTWEERVLKRMKVVVDHKWLNRHDSMTPHLQKGDQHWARVNPEKAKKLLGGKNNYIYTKPGELEKRREHMTTNNPASRLDVKEKIRAKQLALGDNHPMKSKEARARVSATSKENWTTIRKQEQSERMKERWQHKRFRKIECQHCNKLIGANNYSRYHGNNCKHNLANPVGNTDKAVYNNLVGSI